jgi:hypothetical protein
LHATLCANTKNDSHHSLRKPSSGVVFLFVK